jgi:hypothetical protein
MGASTQNRQAGSAGGCCYEPGVKGRDHEALLVLSDGSVWSGRSVGSTAVASGEVRLVGSLAAVGEGGLLAGLDLKSLQKHLSAKNARRGAIRGCITAAGATFPLHAAVALAVARGDIGRP